MLNENNFSVWINTYNRPEELNENIISLRNSLPESIKINIISNHSRVELHDDYPNVKVHMNEMRPDSSWGYLARNWNQCYYMGLHNHEYILATQDDMIFKEGWFELINESKKMSFYLAPVGDLAHIASRESFLEVGWWDERFVGIDFQDFDYIFRVYQNLRDKSSVVDNATKNIWNDIGLADYWIGEGYIGENDRPRGYDRIHSRMNRLFLGFKRGMDWSENPKCHKDPRWRDITRKYVVGEIDWYPWFTFLMQEKTGLKQSFMNIPYKNFYDNDGYGK